VYDETATRIMLRAHQGQVVHEKGRVSMDEGVTVLVIDDDPLVRTTFVRMLQRQGVRALSADDGQRGLEVFRAARPDVVLSDLRMPGMDGLEVLSALVAEAPETPVIVVSGEGGLQDAVQALRRGAWDFVTKPVIDPELLVRSVDRALEKARLRRQNGEYRAHLERTNQALVRALGELHADQQGARALQHQLLPRDGLQLGRYRAHRRLFPAQVLSGDFVDYFMVGEDHAAFYLADVSGHGAASAFVTAILSTLVAKYRQAFSEGREQTALEPAELLVRLDRDLSALELGKHVSLFYGVLALSSGRLQFANAGLYPYPLLAEGTEVRPLETSGRPLGLPGRGGPTPQETDLPVGARLLAISDGVLELGPERPHRERRDELAALLARSGDVDQVAHGLGLGASEAPPLRDDVALFFLQAEAPHA
jgi:sigma-B regulation protein RsbU (phosphoserine phosphatase)